MCRRNSRLALFGVLAFVTGLFAEPAIRPLRADDESKTIDYPLVVFNVAGIQRLQDNAKFMFETANHPHLVDLVEKWTVTTLKDFHGIDRTKPFGTFTYMPSSFVGTPVTIAYVPITNLDDALQTFAYGAGTINAVDGKRGWNEIRYGANFVMRTRQVGDYLFMVGPDGDEETLDKNFPDPIKLTSRLSSQYDAAVSLQIKNVPPTMKTLFLEFLKNSAQAEMQQRDGEPESAYRLRRANGDSWLELIDRVIMQGEEFTIGGRMDPDARKAHIDFEIAGTSDSKLAKFFQDMSGKKTHFGNLIANPATFTMSASWLLSEKQRPLMAAFFDAARKDLADVSSKNNVDGLGPLVEPLLKALAATADAGHVDLFAQLLGDEPGRFALVAGARVNGGRNLPNQIAELLEFAKANSNGNQVLEQLEIASSEIDSVPVHRVQINPPDKPGQRMFGETAHLYLHVTPQVIWVSFGGDAALEQLNTSVAQVALPQDPQQNRGRVPFLFVTHASNWLTVADDSNRRAEAFNEQARAAFQPENDAMQILVRPTDSGMRTRIEFEEGFIALMGRGFAKGIEQGVFQGGRRRGRQNDEDPPAATEKQ